MAPPPSRTLHEVLLIESERADAALVRHAFAESDGGARLHLVESGREALDFLMRQGRHTGAPRPDLLLLGAALPDLTGLDILRFVRSTPVLQRLPVAILTTPGDATDLASYYTEGASCCVNKPADIQEFLHTMRAIHDFWLGVVRLPTAPVEHDSPAPGTARRR
jgi:two-component system response regulator